MPVSTGTGRAFVFRGGAPLDTVIDVTFGPESNGSFGWDVDAGYDVDADGFLDLAVGAPGHNGGRGRFVSYRGGSPLGVTVYGQANGTQAGALMGFSIGWYNLLTGIFLQVGTPLFDTTLTDVGRISAYCVSSDCGSASESVAGARQGWAVSP